MAVTVLTIRSGLFRLILSFLHIVYSGLQYFDIAWALFKRKLENLSQLKCTDTQLYVSRFVTNLEKCPNHFAVILGTENINFEDFSNLVLWCYAAGLGSSLDVHPCPLGRGRCPEHSEHSCCRMQHNVCPQSGNLKDNEDLYYKYLINRKKIDEKYVIFNVYVNGTKNGYKRNGYTEKIHVNVLSMENGKESFSKLVRKICERALDDEVKPGDISESFIDEELKKILCFNDPDLAVVCGKICATFGFLPWHIRLTEFLQVPTIENITVSEFTSILRKYSMCRQRFGR